MTFFSAFDFLNKGGWVAWVLAMTSLVLWYALGYRFLFLRSSQLHKDPERVLQSAVVGEDVLSESLRRIQEQMAAAPQDIVTVLQFEWVSFCQKISEHRVVVNAIVIVAPLLGLLGTVIGMIETFDSLKDAALFTQGGGIAGGISQALITTQMGLVVAIPGLLVGRKLDQQEKVLVNYMERVIGQIQTQEVANEI
jgi:biopolymer transport protein ExbB